MAYVLSLRPQSPLKRSFSDNPFLRTCSPLKPDTSGTLLDITARNVSVTSFKSAASNKTSPWSRGNENTPPPLTSRSLLDLVHEIESEDFGEKTNPRSVSCGAQVPAPPSKNHQKQPDLPSPRSEPVRHGDLDQPSEHIEQRVYNQTDNSENGYTGISSSCNLYDATYVPSHDGRFSDCTESQSGGLEDNPITVEVTPPPFKRWMSTLRRRHNHRRKERTTPAQRWSFELTEGDDVVLPPLPHISESLHKKTESMSSSLGFVTAMKSASITIASASIAHRSDAGGVQGKVRIGNRSSHFSEARRSTDSNGPSLGLVIDESAWLRSVQRRKIVEELISSEESYIADLKVLVNDYFMLMASVPALPTQTRASIQQNIWQILQFHQDLLADLQSVVPHADYTQSSQHEGHFQTKVKHIRFHSADTMPGRFAEHKVSGRLRRSFEIGRSPDRGLRTLSTDTNVAGQVARIFNKYMNRFFAYEEYGAHWTAMSQNLTTICKGFQGWQEYERGVEALSKVISSDNNRDANSRKALSFSDLLIKPIQRVCRYPLLFEELCRHTPVYDDPEAHAELEKALYRLQEAIREVNKAKDDPKTRNLIETTWQLQDRLAFQEKTISRALVFRLLGHVLMCGVLHVAFQTPDRVKGQYMICVLYKSCLVLATTNRLFTPYNVVAAIPLANGAIEEPDNGRGLQCHTAQHTWKLTFESGHRLYEVILSACSAQEEEIWKRELQERIQFETHDLDEGRSTIHDMFSSLSLDIRSIGPVFGHAEALVRRMSVHRAATLGPKVGMTQVIIKNTQAQKSLEPSPSFTASSVARSQSHMSATAHVPTLAPRRAERIRLETALEEVWTKDMLPYPGMGSRRGDNPIRASANSVMRKLSMASIASNFSKRSPSFSSLSQTRSEESFGKGHKVSQANIRARSSQADRRPAPAVVDFHNAPAAFLPTDFELQDTRPSTRRRRFANRATGIDRSSERPSITRPRRTRRLSIQLTSLPRMEHDVRTESRNGSSASNATNATILRTCETAVDASKLRENEKRRATESTVSEKSDLQAVDTPPAKKFLRSRGKIFKFWI